MGRAIHDVVIGTKPLSREAGARVATSCKKIAVKEWSNKGKSRVECVEKTACSLNPKHFHSNLLFLGRHD